MSCNNANATEFSTAALISLIKNLTIACPQDLVVNSTGLNDGSAIRYFGRGNNSFWSASLGLWSVYRAAAILSLLIDFKLPLLVLISQLPRPKLSIGWKAQVLAVLHLVGDPIDSMSFYLFTLATCTALLRGTHQLVEKRTGEGVEAFAKRCRLIVLVYLSYASIGVPKTLKTLVNLEAKYSKPFHTAALSLAADRSSNFWPVGVAIFSFLMSILLKYVYIDKKTFNPDSPQHVAIWSLSSSMIMVCVVPNVLFATIIGVQQSRHTAGRFLWQFEEAVARELGVPNPDSWIVDKLAERQLQNGAVANWRPDGRGKPHPNSDADLTFPWRILDITASLIVVAGSVGAITLSSMVPPLGFNCRTAIKVIMILIYLGKYGVQLAIHRLGSWSTRTKMHYTMLADSASLLSFAFIIFITQCGVLNRHGCYRICYDVGKCGIFPASATWDVVQERLRWIYPGILFGFLGMQLVICAFILLFFKGATSVYLEDDEPFPLDELSDNVTQAKDDKPKRQGLEDEGLLEACQTQEILAAHFRLF